MIQDNNRTYVLFSQIIHNRAEARELRPEEKLSPLDLDVYERVIEKADLLPEDDYQIVVDAINEDCGLGCKQLLDTIRYLNEKIPEDRILIPSEYVTDAREATEPDWVIPGIAVRNNSGLIVGDAGVGKTTFYLYLTDALMNGSEFAGIRCTRCRPLIVSQDEDHSLLKSHWATMGKTSILPVAKKDIVWDKSKCDFNQDFEMTLKAYQPDIVFVDSYTSLGIPDITRPESGLVYDAINKMARHNKCSIILIHHTNLSGEQMGSSLHRAKVSSIVSISKLGDDRIMVTQDKVRGTHFEPIAIHFNRETLLMTRQPGNVKDEVRRLMRQGKTEEEIVSGLPASKKETVKRYIRECRLERNTAGG